MRCFTVIVKVMPLPFGQPLKCEEPVNGPLLPFVQEPWVYETGANMLTEVGFFSKEGSESITLSEIY